MAKVLLLQAPLMENIDRTKSGLPEFKSEVWQGFLFVNLDGKAKPIASRLSSLDDLLKNYHTHEMHHVFATEEVWEANWKCLIENFMESYHLSRVHPQTLGGRTPTKLCVKFDGGEGYTGYRAHYPITAPFRGNCHPDLTDQEKGCSTLFCVYPAMVVSQSSDVLVYMRDMPEEDIQARIALWKEINAEDQAKLAKIQHSLNSKSAISGPLAPDDFEGTLRDFYKYLASQYAEKPIDSLISPSRSN